MKTIVDTAVGGDGARAGLYLDGADLVARINYPVAKILQPVNDVIDAGVKKLEDLIPGDWDKAILEPIAAGMKADLLALLSASISA